MWKKGIKPGFVFVGEKGESYYSPAGNMGWNAMSGLDASADYNDVAYGMGRFVCVGTAGKSYYSTDARTWKPMSGLNTSVSYDAVTYGGDRFVCVGDSGKAYYSTDGAIWHAMTGLDVTMNYNTVAYVDGTFICGGSNHRYVYKSKDGLNWSYLAQVGTDTSVVNSIAYCNGTLYAAGKYKPQNQNTYYGAIYKSASSTHSLWNYSPTDMTTVMHDCYDIAYGNGISVCVGEANDGWYHGSNGILKDGETKWTFKGTGETCYGVAYGAGVFVKVGSLDGFYYGTTGETWTKVPSGRTGTAQNTFKAIAYGGET